MSFTARNVIKTENFSGKKPKRNTFDTSMDSVRPFSSFIFSFLETGGFCSSRICRVTSFNPEKPKLMSGSGSHRFHDGDS